MISDTATYKQTFMLSIGFLRHTYFSYSFNTPVGFIVYPLDSLLESTISDPATFVFYSDF